MKHRIAILGDIHFPYHNKSAMNSALDILIYLRPTYIVQIGDLYDQYSFSRFTRKNITSPETEIKQARALAVEMWAMLNKHLPKAKKYQLLGNHDVRLIKRAQEKLPEAQDVIKKSVMELYKFKGVTTIQDDREVLKIRDVAFHHGYLSKIGDHCKTFHSSCVVGHSHVGGIYFEQRNSGVIYELNAGYLADELAEPLRYRPTTTCKWTLGVGFIDQYGPRFIPINPK